MTRGAWHPKKPTRHGYPTGRAVAVCAIACIATAVVLLRHREFWSPDAAVRFVQAEAMRRAAFNDVAVPYPAAAFDPEGRFFPAGPWFHFMRAGQHYLSYSPYFPALAGVLYNVGGYAGLLVVPVAAGIAALLVTARFLDRVAPALSAPGVVAVGLGTPLFIYSVVFWDHSLVAALATGALALTATVLWRPSARAPARLGLAGVLLGIGLWFRNEMYLLVAALLAAWLAWGGKERIGGAAALGAGVMVGALPAAVVNTRLFGSPLGWKGQDLVTGRLQGFAEAAGGGQAAGWLANKLGNAYYQLISPDFYAFNPRAVAVGLGIAAVLLVGTVLLVLGVRQRVHLPVLVGGAVVAITAILVASGRTALSGLLVTAPVVVLGLVGGRRQTWEWYLWTVVVLFTGAVIVTGTHGGLQWGPRYLLPVVPALVWLAVAAVDRARQAAPALWPSLRLAAGLVLGASVLVQAAGVEHVDASLARNARVNEALRTAPAEVVVTGLEWLVLGAGPVYFEKQLMLVRNAEDLRVLATRLSERQVERWTYVPWSGSAYDAEQVARWTAGASWRFHVADDRLVHGIRLVTYEGRP
ncbi:MAG: hypothetical protein QN157_12855 [Armatimonadota bacterium]|nr:hypothetical protein [Armatimonadota bacterium]